MSLFKNVLGLIAVAAIVALVVYVSFPSRTLRSEKISAYELLTSEQLLFIATDKIVTQVVVEVSETDLFLGDEYSVAFAVAELVYGINLEKIEDDDILQTEGQLLIDLPMAEVFSVRIRPETIVAITKSTILQKLATRFSGENASRELLVELEAQATQFAKANGLFPSQDDVNLRIGNFFQLVYPNLDVLVTNTPKELVITQ